MAPPPDQDDPPRRRTSSDATLRGLRIERLEETIDEPPTTDVGFGLRGEVVGGRFRLGERLSWGGMGTVYRALDQVTGQEVAVKIPHLGDAQTDARFQSETAAVASVVCSSVIGFVAHGSTEEPFLAMELVRGEPLYKHLQRGPLDVTATTSVGLRIASALAAIHLGGWVHRDIKPGNIVVDLDGTAKLLDFGLSRHVESSTVTSAGQVLGTLGYMAPEQLVSGRKKIDPRADVYALGVVLYECLTGKRAFNRTVADVVERRVTSALDVGALGLPPALEAAIEGATSPGRDERVADGLDLLFRFICAVDPLFQPPALAEARVGIGHLLRTGAVHVSGDDASGRPARDRAQALARGFAEIVAPSFIVRLGCEPVLTNTEGAHAAAIARTLEASGHASLAARLRNQRTANQLQTRGSVIVLLDDGWWCDAWSAEQLAALASERSLFLITSSALESESVPRPFDAVPRVGAGFGEPSDVTRLTPMARWCLRAAGVFGWRFSLAGVSELVGGPEAEDVPKALGDLASAGLVGPLGEGRFVFTSSRALAAARRLARPSEARLGAKIARMQRAEELLAEPLMVIEATCAQLATAPA